MAKRFTDTDKWRDPWFCGLTCSEKLFWSYLLDTCNLAGIWQVNWPLVKFYIPDFEFRPERFGDRIQVLNGEKWHIPKFVKFQYGELQPTNRLHQRIIFELQKDGVSIPLKYPSQGVKDKDMDKTMDKDMVPLSLGGGAGGGGGRFVKPAADAVQAYAKSIGFNGLNVQRFMDYYESNGWRVGRNPMKDWKAAVRQWRSREGENGNGKRQGFAVAKPGKYPD